MNMTGDPNQRNTTSMFGFEGAHPNPFNLPNYSGHMVSAAPAAPMNQLQNPSQCMLSTNSASPFPYNVSISPTVAHVPYNPNFAFSASNVLPPTNVPSFQYLSTPIELSSNFLEVSQMANNAAQIAVATEHPSIHMATPQLTWAPAVKSTFDWALNVTPSVSGAGTKPVSGTFACKRKTESPPLSPLKQHITEERMAEHMSRLHISSQTPTSSTESDPIRERRLYMCEEMQRLQTESIIPAQILESINRPCTALVPWRPPIVPPVQTKENNNNEDEQDNNLMEDMSEMTIADMES